MIKEGRYADAEEQERALLARLEEKLVQDSLQVAKALVPGWRLVRSPGRHLGDHAGHDEQQHEKTPKHVSIL